MTLLGANCGFKDFEITSKYQSPWSRALFGPIFPIFAIHNAPYAFSAATFWEKHLPGEPVIYPQHVCFCNPVVFC